MNLGLLMGIGSPSIPMNSAPSTVNIEGEGFGSVFQSLMSATAIPAKPQTLGADQELTKLLGEVLNADSLEELEGLLEELKQSVKSPIVAQLLKEAGLRQTISVKGTAVEKISTEIIEKTIEEQTEELKLEQATPTQNQNQIQNSLVQLTEEAEELLGQMIASLEKESLVNGNTELTITDLPNLHKFPSLQQLAALISENPDKLIEVVTNVLEDVGVTKTQLDEIAATGDIWFVLDVLQQLPPEKIKIAMEQLPPKVTVELTALLKTIELTAHKMDLFTKQLNLVKTIQPILSQFASQLEANVVQPEAKQPVQIPSAMQHVIRFTTEQSAADAKQQDQQSKANETVTPVTATTQNEARPVFQMNTTEKVPESRSEALMREFQAVLNRANFGQTNGMNRISIKLYPEHLGQIRIELLEVNGVMTARILASTAMAREMLDSQMHQLRHAFNQQNLQMDRIDLSQTLQDPSKSDREQAFNKQNQQQKEQATDQNETQDEQQQTFQEFMIELEA
ncbi:hypothetical protein CSV69_02920 [Sporosarcina sp. P26b]|uniref:flagellar hook-length control protein FliK n=1 Tax=Sporosarcina sp. P26b TaxID=2048253 RepID=UPI000C16A213|nr:flagellar hook-length control protein FliK [Sporosarcina sp. P26b]PIC97174.1 hypothetical protein CSV69_02920 [Sporosarcina sp. P26b]